MIREDEKDSALASSGHQSTRELVRPVFLPSMYSMFWTFMNGLQYYSPLVGEMRLEEDFFLLRWI